MVWGSLPGTEIPDYEESTILVFSLWSGIFLYFKSNNLFQEVKNELFNIAKN